MAYVVNCFIGEHIYSDKPKKLFNPMDTEIFFWKDGDEYGKKLEIGTIKFLTGRELKMDDEPVYVPDTVYGMYLELKAKEKS